MTDPTLPILREVTQIPGLLKDIYGDLAKPGVEQVGKALGTVLGLGNTILWPLTMLNERAKIALEKNLEKYRRQLDGKDKIVAVSPEVGVPVLEKTLTPIAQTCRMDCRRPGWRRSFPLAR